MYSKIAILSSLVLAMFLLSCKKENDSHIPQPGKGVFIDHGFIPVAIEINPSADIQEAIHSTNKVFVATSDGIWKNDLTTKAWSRSGLEGKRITFIYKHPTIDKKFFAGISPDSNEKTLYVSTDEGQTWTAVESPVYSSLESMYEVYVCMAIHPAKPNIVFANLMGGTTIAVSKDGGNTWHRNNYAEDSNFSYPCPIAVIPGNTGKIYQGAEAPLDDAWLATYDINTTDPVMLSNFQKVIDMDIWENRRPNELATFPYTPNTLYVGQEGALSKVTGNQSVFIYKSDEKSTFPYSYIEGIWVDPANTKHILFGGAVNGEQTTLSLYETQDEGKTVAHISDKLGMTEPQVREIIATDSYPAILIKDDILKKARLVLYKNQ
ncbi:hypothetical protein QNI19_28740 [Cytophagaceae bacterium DM2B3-1]|uniref:Sortilin N-terminal domain-containing protein n=1 Tax=Xanthocytophaga flava TaxID=3048013 RepID=A0ABT7CT99_9BACT|nr:hypothetical protein [Xanthocytophaga flavus]MDJ1496958.1 hypothetical protein [Xanthocytophaga flavus]